MKKILIPIGALLVTSLAHAQLSPTENYVFSKTYLSDPALPNPKTSETVQYFDGLGRPKQVVNVKASPLGRDVVNHIEYDGFGRQAKDFLPIPQSQTLNGAIVPNPLGNSSAIYGGEKIYAEKILENSPLDRIQQQIQVGTDWSTKPVKFDYEANIDGEVKKYVATFNYSNFTSSITLSGNYGGGQLYKNTVTDEDGNKTIEFKNGQGQVLLVRKVNGTENVDTYYVYNDYNQLAYVIPPLASVSGATDETTLNNLCYQYKYDGRNRLVEKKLPGKGWEYMVYDKADRLILTQDSVMRLGNNWLLTKYDNFGRVIFTAIIKGLSRTEWDNILKYMVIAESRSSTGYTKNGMDIYYTNNYFAPDVQSVLTVNYYDSYPAYSFNPSFPSSIINQPTLTDNPTATGKSTKGLPVMSLVKNIEDDNWTKNYSYYDQKGRVVGTYSINHLGGYTKTESELDFAGVTKQAITRHKRLDSDTERIITETFEYDHQNRLLVHKHKIDNNTEEILTQNKYNELSQLESKKVGGTNLATPLQTIDYTYNIRGWMTKINDPADLNGKLFGYEMRYTNPESGLYPGKFNGNITEVDWKTTTDGQRRRYNYGYDALNRLQHAVYQKPGASVVLTSAYNEWLQYDLNGNITRLNRYGNSDGNSPMQIDELYYAYSGNRLNSVTDASGNYNGYPDVSGNTIAYDDNGNMKDQKDKGILEIDYNFLNLPNYLKFDKLYFTRGTWQNENVTSFYRADGTKLRKEHRYTDTTGYKKKTTDYLDGFQYETFQNLGSTILKFTPTSEGYFNFENNKYIYNYVDHLGNIRVSYTNNGSGAEVLEESNYYPFGLKHEGYNALAGNPAYNYKYNRKELQETGAYDFGARQYMPDIGRWVVVDPLAEKMRRFSPYTYAGDNPIRYIDPDGRKFINFDENGNYTGTTKDNWWHNLWNGSKGRVVKSDGSTQQKFRFADPKNDVADIQSGKINKLEFVTEKQVRTLVSWSGAFDPKNKASNRSLSERYDYIKKEGIGGGKMDFAYTQVPKMFPNAKPSNPTTNTSNTIFLVEGLAHNQNNFGNFLFGASGRAMQFTGAELSLGAHYNSVVNSSTNGYSSQLDSSDDQLSISSGVLFSDKYNYGDKQIQVTVGTPTPANTP